MADPPSFYGRGPQTGRLPQPIDAARPLAEGVDAIARATGRAADSIQQTNDQVRESDLQIARINRERELQLRTGDVAAFIANQQGDLQTDVIKLREKAAPGAAGHEDQVNQRIAQFRETVTNYIGNDPELAGRFVDNIAAVGANARVGEATWAATQRALKSKDDYETLDDRVGNNIRTAVMNGTFTEQTFKDAAALRESAVAALPVGGEAKTQLLKAGRITDLTSLAQALIDTNPHGALDAIDKGHFDELPTQTRDGLRTRARVAADRLDNEAEQKAGAAAAVARATEGNLIEDVNKGVLVDPAALQAAQARASASQKPEDIRLAHDLEIAAVKNGVTAKFDVSTNDDRLAALRQIEGTKDWQKNRDLVAAHGQLQALISRDEHAAEADILPLYTRQTGVALEAADLQDPASMSKRFRIGDLAAERFHKPPAYFTEDEAKHQREQYNAATPGAKADFMLTLGAYGSNRARAIMRQLAPNKPELARLVELSSFRDPAISGLVREAQDGAALPQRDGAVSAIDNAARGEFGSALARLPGDRRRAVLTVASWIYAHRAAASGKGTAHLDHSLALDSLQAALGGAGNKGGFGRARNGEPMVLPTAYSQRDFDTVWASASNREFLGAANGGAYWDGNKPMSESEFKQLTPVLISDTPTQALYAFRSKGGSGYVKTQRGDDFVLDFRRLLPIVKAGDR